MGKVAARIHGGRLRPLRQPDPLAAKIIDRGDTGGIVDEETALPENPRREDGQPDKFGLWRVRDMRAESRKRIFRDIELSAKRKAQTDLFERVGQDVQVDAFRPDPPGHQIPRVRVVADCHRQ